MRIEPPQHTSAMGKTPDPPDWKQTIQNYVTFMKNEICNSRNMNPNPEDLKQAIDFLKSAWQGQIPLLNNGRLSPQELEQFNYALDAACEAALIYCEDKAENPSKFGNPALAESMKNAFNEFDRLADLFGDRPVPPQKRT